jgi:tetraacyldisaccharide 4'-kinase
LVRSDSVGQGFSPAETSAENETGALAPAKIHLLDDGFQHRQLARAIDVVLLNRHDWGDFLLPAGNLREPVEALRRAHAIAIPAEEPPLETALRNHLAFTGPVWKLHRQMDIPPIAGPVVAFCGIARPEQFFSGLEAAGLHVASRIAFRDHHRYIPHDIDCLLDAARSVSATAFITTDKDLVRIGPLTASLSATLPLETAKLRVEIQDEPAAVDWLTQRIEKAVSRFA